MHSYRALVSVARRNNFFQNRSGTRAGGWAKGLQLKVLEPEDGFASTRDACATLRQFDALK
jgi:hypothetical protein